VAATPQVEGFSCWIDLVGCGTTACRNLEWMGLFQKWIAAGGASKAAFCVTKGLAAHLNQSINLTGADRAGLYRMVSSEYRRLYSRHIDVESELDDESLVDIVLAELDDRGQERSAVCYRGGVRFAPELAEVAQFDADPVPAFTFDEKEVLWITGGTRGI